MSPVGSRWVGARVLRAEDPRLVAGGGNYLEDQTPPGTLVVAIYRSSFAHARIRRLDTTAAAALPGVRAVITAVDLGSADGAIPVVWRANGMRVPTYRPLAREVVHHSGQPIAAVVADTRYVAEDALELIECELDPLPVVTSARAALAEGAPILHEELGTNEAYRMKVQNGEVAEAFRAADLVVETELAIQRQTAAPMERRGVIAMPGPGKGELTIWATIQHPHLYRRDLAPLLGLPESKLRVIAPDVGGAFGAYYQVYPEDAIVGRLALLLGRPVKWVEDRRESFLGTVHARQQHHRAQLAVRADGRILGLRDEIVSDIGAYSDYSGIGPSFLTANFLTGVYDIQAVDIDLRCAYTNKVRGGAYRGFGAPQAVFVIERLVEMAARRLGLDPHEMRRRNVIGPDQFPYRIASGLTYDSGNYPGLLEKVSGLVGYEELVRWRDAARAAGRLAGIGTALYAEFTGTGPSRSLGLRGYRSAGYERVTVRVDSDGSITATSGAAHLGQGIRTALSQLCAEALGVRPENVNVLTGDTSVSVDGNRGSIGSRSAVVAGQAAYDAAVMVRDRARLVAAHLLEAPPEDVVAEDGRFHVVGSATPSIGYREVAEAAILRHDLPPDLEPGLEATATFDPPAYAFASGVHVAAVEVEPGTGRVRIVKYGIVHDCGRVINPMIVDGQVLGATAQGIGAALLEELRYDESGQLLTGSLMDYLLPTSLDVPRILLDHQETPAPFLATGAKGAGEGGTLGPPAAIANAVSDAIGIELTETPLSPERVWSALQGTI